MNASRIATCLAVGAALTAPFATSARAQGDSLRLSSVRTAAVAADPRTAQLELLASQSALRLRNIAADLKPSLTLDGLAQYQSDVAGLNVNLPGIQLPTPAKDTYDARLGVQQRIYDPSISARRAVERAQLGESQARVRSAIYSLNESANTAFFTALRSQNQIAELETTIRDLEAQLEVANSRVRSGTALQSESNTLRAELLRHRQSVAEQRAARNAAIAILSDLTGKPIDPATPLATPDLATEVTQARSALAAIRSRPEYEQFERTREVVSLSQRARAAEEKPRLSAFGRAGYGRPGLNPLSNKFDSYWLSGIQFQWSPGVWGTSSRDRQIAELQRQIVTTEEQAFSAQLERAIEQDLASIDRLASSLADDEQIIALRENIFAETRARYRESVITSAEYVDRQTDVLSARLSRALHRVELAQAHAHLLTTLGMEVR
jgi:outer membrane protein TolC